MESLISEGLIAGVLDVTTTELADEHVGGFLSAGPDRLTAAGKAGIPQVVSTGALDMVNFYAPGIGPRQIQGPSFLQAQRQRHADADHAGRERAYRRQHGAQAVGGEGAGRRPAPGARRVRDRQRGTAVRRPGRAQGAPRRDPRRCARD